MDEIEKDLSTGEEGQTGGKEEGGEGGGVLHENVYSHVERKKKNVGSAITPRWKKSRTCRGRGRKRNTLTLASKNSPGKGNSGLDAHQNRQ